MLVNLERLRLCLCKHGCVITYRWYIRVQAALRQQQLMLKKFIKKIKKLSQENYYLSPQRPDKAEQQVMDQESAESELINSMTNYKLILAHLKDQQQEQVKFMKLIKALAVEEIDLPQLKHLFYNYISYQYYTLRSLIWRVLVGYLPIKNNKWITKTEANKVAYEKLLTQNLISTIKRRPRQSQTKEKVESDGSHKMIVGACIDHPLNRNSNSTWNAYFKDHQLWIKIERDILRTRTKVKFFQEEHELQLETVEFEEPLNLSKNKRSCYHYDAVSRILFLFCKLHPQIGYSQGMNQIAALLYYVFTNKNTQYERRVSQADAYYVFCIIMSMLGPQHFSSPQYMNERIKVFCEALKKVDQKLYKLFQDNKIDLKLACMRWIMVLMLQEFQINEAILIWDGLLCAEIGMNKYIYYLCLAVMVIKRDELMENPTSVFSELKSKPKELLETANHLYKEYPHLVG